MYEFHTKMNNIDQTIFLTIQSFSFSFRNSSNFYIDLIFAITEIWLTTFSIKNGNFPTQLYNMWNPLIWFPLIKFIMYKTKKPKHFCFDSQNVIVKLNYNKNSDEINQIAIKLMKLIPEKAFRSYQINNNSQHQYNTYNFISP